MTDEENDIFYVCTLIEYIARATTNHRGDIVKALGIDGIKKQLHDASVNHCLSFEQVSDELQAQYHIQKGSFDTITGCKYSIPSYISIGKLYYIIIMRCTDVAHAAEEIYKIFSSFISDAISNFSSDLYYQNPDYLKCSYEEGHLLD